MRPFVASVTAIELWKRCPRRYAFKKVARLPEPKSPWAQDGIDLHGIAENYLKTGQVRGAEKLVEIFEPEIPFLPRHFGALAVERPFKFQIDGCTFYGIVDWVDWASRVKGDHKFVSTFDWILSSDDLHDNLQTLLYALAPPSWDVVTVQWNYVSKKVRECRPSETQITRGEAQAYVRRVALPVWYEIDACRRELAGVDELDAVGMINRLVPCEPEDCWSYGQPCAFARHCTHKEPYV